MLKVVLDTNIIVSATIDKKSIPNEVLRLWQKGKIKVILSPAIIEEMWHVLF
jgi:putative PIN family toxin of toxin-antitoxin system